MFAELQEGAFLAAALAPFALGAAQALPGIVQLPAAELVVGVEAQAVLDESVFAFIERLAFLGEVALFVGQLFLAEG